MPLESARPTEFSELPQFGADPAAAPLLPLEFCLERSVVVLGTPHAQGPLDVGMLAPADRDLVAELESRLSRPVRSVQLNRFEIRRAIAVVHRVPLGDADGALVQIDAARSIGFHPDQAAASILEDLLSVAIRRRATDIHIETYHLDVDLRLRIDGVLHQVTTPLSPENLARVVSRIKVLCGLDLAERRRAQDGRFSILYREDGAVRRIDLRVTVMPGLYGQDVALRVLDPARFILDLDHLAMPGPILERYRRLIRTPAGLLLTTGPTGAGKTTTLYATLQALRADHLKILTVEDPVEYEFPKVNQKNVTPQMGFAEHLRAFLRANPDVLLIGEIRDRETAEIAIRAGTTGHLVLSTLHTRDALSAIERLRVLGVADDSLSDVLLGILGQRLLRRICEGCREPAVPPPELSRLYYRTAPDRPQWRGRGCERCDGTGYRGLIGVFELLQPDEAVSTAIGRGALPDEIRRLAAGQGWQPLVEDALGKSEAGLTSLEEVARRLPPRFPGA
jgi:type II secretory ATPase GspE/PulE/Tfp pilus assembly ATPase PilB-like protein